MAFFFLHTLNFRFRLLHPFKVFHRCFPFASNIKEYEVNIKTCGNLYKKWRVENKFKNVPNGDLSFKITYIDNGNALKTNSAPIIVAIHGAHGSYKDFVGLFSYFEGKARVIVPNFPDFSAYKPGIFRFSDEEKAQLTKDFLAAISVSQIDALVIHSSGIYPGLHLCLDNNLVKSLILLNPATYSYGMKGVRHIKHLRRLVAVSEIPVIFKVLEFLGPTLLKLGKVPVRTDNFLDPLLSVTTTVYANLPEAKAKFLHLSRTKLPTLYAFSEDDKLIGGESSYELAHFLGVSKEEIYAYDKDGVMINEGKNSSILKVMSFEKGSHYVFWKHADIIRKAIEDFLRSNRIIV